MGETAWQQTEDAVRAAFAAGDLAGLGPLLAPDVRWHGAGPGGCHSAAEVLAFIERAAGEGARFRPVALRRAGDRVLLHVVVEPNGPEVHQLLVLDDEGWITHLLDHADPAAAERDLTPPRADTVSTPAPAPVGRLVPFVDVSDVAATVSFYALLGFQVTAEHRPHGRLVWAALASGAAELMVAETERPPDPSRQGVLFYLYTTDLDELREHLRAHGAASSGIEDGSPGPRREMRVDDPDGYCLMIASLPES